MSLSSKGECNITTIERDDKMIEIAKNNIEKYSFKDKIKIIQGDCLEILKDLEDKYDMILWMQEKDIIMNFYLIV